MMPRARPLPSNVDAVERLSSRDHDRQRAVGARAVEQHAGWPSRRADGTSALFDFCHLPFHIGPLVSAASQDALPPTGAGCIPRGATAGALSAV
jgi:hypothetical protein